MTNKGGEMTFEESLRRLKESQAAEIAARKAWDDAQTPDCSKDKFNWELIYEHHFEGTSRAKVPGGWLVVHWFDDNEASTESMVFVPDPTHIWTVNKEDK